MALGFDKLTEGFAGHVDVPKQFTARGIPCPYATFKDRHMAIP